MKCPNAPMVHGSRTFADQPGGGANWPMANVTKPECPLFLSHMPNLPLSLGGSVGRHQNQAFSCLNEPFKFARFIKKVSFVALAPVIVMQDIGLVSNESS